MRNLTLALVLALMAGAAGLARPDDGQAGSSPFVQYERPAQSSGVSTRSLYVPMRDGVRLAVDVALPGDLPPGTRVPAILMIDRQIELDPSTGGILSVVHHSDIRYPEVWPFEGPRSS